MNFGIIISPAAPVRLKPRHNSEMTNQLVFGEPIKIIKTKKQDWYKVKSLYDDYVGWITYHHIKFTKDAISINESTYITTELTHPILYNNDLLQLPFGAFLHNYKKGAGTVLDDSYTYQGKAVAFKKTTPQQLKEIAMQWLNAPYLWGGKTLMGVDCSGFAQNICKALGTPILRDAWQQAQQGTRIKELEESRLGDLAFFDDDKEIVHVGIILGGNTIIHAAGKVRIDAIDTKGIRNIDTGKRTHRLKLIKRYL